MNDNIVNNLILFYFYLILINHNLLILNTDFAYIGIFFCIFAIFFNLIKINFYKNYTSFFIFLSLFSWFYGVILGYFNSNPLEAIIRNFAGITFYIFFFILKIKINDYKKIINFTVYSSLSLFLILILNSEIYDVSQLLKLNLELFYKVGSSAFRKIWSSHLSLIIFLNTLSFFYLLKPNFIFHKIKSLNFVKFFSIIFYLLSLVLIIKSGSKGFWLSLIFCKSVLFFSALINFRYFSVLRLLFCFFIFIIIIILFKTQIENFYSYLLYLEFNIYNNRIIQFEELMNEISFFGIGLGGSLESGYSRDDLNYGFELTFLNLLHKLGIFSLPIILIYIFVIFKSVFNLFFFRNYFNSLISLTLVSFCIPGAFNPLLFSPFNVILHTLSFIFLSSNFYNLLQSNYNNNSKYYER